MSADYDLVILGGTLEGRFAASLAAGYGARVALIEPPGIFAQRQQVRYLLKGLQQLARGKEAQAVSTWFSRSASPFDFIRSDIDSLDWQALVEWSAIATETQLLPLSSEVLNSRGVDFIWATPEFLSRHASPRRLQVVADRRSLSTRAVLAAFGTVPRSNPASDPNAETGARAASPINKPLITGVESLLQSESLPKEISILGDSFIAVDWAEALSAMGTSVTLVADRFLRDEDSDVRAVVRSQLLTAGIKIISSQHRETQYNREPHKEEQHLSPTIALPIALQLGRHKPALTLPDFVYQPNSGYQGIDAHIQERPYLLSNSRLQTAHPRIFACGSLLRRRVFPESVAQHEAQVAVRNALFFPTQRTNYNTVVQAYARFAKVGRTPKFSKEGRAPISRGYREFSASLPNSVDLSYEIPKPSYCKIICRNNRVQSIQLLGTDAESTITALAPMVSRSLTEFLSAAERVTGPTVVENLSDLVKQAVMGEVCDRWQPTHWRRDWAENWFNWRRSRR